MDDGTLCTGGGDNDGTLCMGGGDNDGTCGLLGARGIEGGGNVNARGETLPSACGSGKFDGSEGGNMLRGCNSLRAVPTPMLLLLLCCCPPSLAWSLVMCGARDV